MTKIKKKWLLTLILVLMVSLALAGCARDEDNTQTGDTSIEDKIDKAKDTLDDAVEGIEDDVRDMTYDDIKITPEEAFDTFMELHPNTKITEIDLDKDLMKYKYSIEGYDNEYDYEIEIDPVNGEIISAKSEIVDLDDRDGEITKEHLAKIENIINKAKKEDGSDSKLDEWNISLEDGKVVIEIEIGLTKYTYNMETETLIEKDI